MCQDWILFINDFSIGKAPESNGRKFYLTSSGSASPSGSFVGSPTAGPDSKNATKQSTPKSALSRMRLWGGGESKNRYNLYVSSFLSMGVFHQTCQVVFNQRGPQVPFLVGKKVYSS